ncbi:MAG: hemerythrin family protein [Halieaceae bacterium]
MNTAKKQCIFGVMEKTSDIIWQDAQHQVLFELLDRIAEEGSATMVLHQLEFYAESHFAIEEQYMEELAYPGQEEHRQAHDKFRQELARMLEDSSEHDQVSRQVISTFLREWLKRHIFGIDKKLEDFILASKVK